MRQYERRPDVIDPPARPGPTETICDGSEFDLSPDDLAIPLLLISTGYTLRSPIQLASQSHRRLSMAG